MKQIPETFPEIEEASLMVISQGLCLYPVKTQDPTALGPLECALIDGVIHLGHEITDEDIAKKRVWVEFRDKNGHCAWNRNLSGEPIE